MPKEIRGIMWNCMRELTGNCSISNKVNMSIIEGEQVCGDQNIENSFGEFNDDSYDFRDTTSSILKVPHPNRIIQKKILDTVGQFCGILYQPMYVMHVILIILNLC